MLKSIAKTRIVDPNFDQQINSRIGRPVSGFFLEELAEESPQDLATVPKSIWWLSKARELATETSTPGMARHTAAVLVSAQHYTRKKAILKHC